MNGERELQVRKNAQTAKAGVGTVITMAQIVEITLRKLCPWQFESKDMSATNSPKPEPVNPNYPVFYEGVGFWRK